VARVVKLWVVLTQQVLVKALRLKKAEAEQTLHLATALNHPLTHTQLRVLHLLHLPHNRFLLKPCDRLVQGVVEEEAMTFIETVLPSMHHIIINVWPIAANTCRDGMQRGMSHVEVSCALAMDWA
jgi:hypothetical protein